MVFPLWTSRKRMAMEDKSVDEWLLPADSSISTGLIAIFISAHM
jgi:hypothetical protein